MAKRLQVGSKVQCRLYNTPDGKFYGNYFIGYVVEVIGNFRFSKSRIEDGYRIMRTDGFFSTLHRKEIKRILE